jgi:hypothetical protein
LWQQVVFNPLYRIGNSSLTFEMIVVDGSRLGVM